MTDPASMPRFPAGFRWGVSTSSYQIEGAVDEDGRGPSVWDTFSHTPGRVADGSTGDVACDHYHRYPEDVALMADLGVDAYRFSVAWPRVQPDGRGRVNAAGLDFYDRLVDALLERDIAPVATLFHWDLPQALQDVGGWQVRDTASRFAEYADVTAAALGDRVKLWITLNEPFVHMSLGHVTGEHAPGLTDVAAAFTVAHHLLLGHGLAVRALRSRTSSPVAVTNSYSPAWAVGPDARPDTATDDDRAAAVVYDAVQNRLFTDPVLLGAYPETLGALLTGADDLVRDGDLDTISERIDTLGVNYYNPTGIRAPGPDSVMPFEMVTVDGYPTTSFGWPVVPDALRELLVLLRDRYGDRLPPVEITENGCSYDCAPHDPERVSYLDSHLRAVHQAIQEGVDVRGYFQWSLMDNFEWAEGFTKRFGLVHVDFETQKRTPKTSFGWYRDLIAGQR